MRFFSITAFIFTFQLSFSQYKVQHFGVKDGLASAYTQSLVQDSLGFLWIQYPGGLTSFDGYNFKIYKHSPENPERSPGQGGIAKVVTDHQGNVWVLGQYKAPFLTVSQYSRKTDSFKKYQLKISNPSAGPIEGDVVQRVRFEKSGKILWVATRSGLYRFNPETETTTSYLCRGNDAHETLLNNFVTDVSVRDSFLLVSTRNGLWKFNHAKKTFSRPACDPKDSAWLYHAEIWEIYEGPDYNYDDIWLVGNHGFSQVNKDLSILRRFDLPGGLYGFGVFNYARDKTGIFWIASVTQGLYKYDPSDNSFINIKRLVLDPAVFSDNIVNSALVDRDQNIWVATDRGISRLQKQKLEFYNYYIPKGDSSVVFSGIHSSIVYQARDKDYLIINHYKKNDTHDILMASIKADRLDSLRFFTAIKGLKGRAVNGFWKGKHKLWISVWGTGVKSVSMNSETGTIESQTLQTISHDPENANTLSSNFPMTIMEDASENLWIGSQDKGITKVLAGILYGDKGSVVRYQHVPGDSNSLVSDEVLAFYPEDENLFGSSPMQELTCLRMGDLNMCLRRKSAPALFINRGMVIYLSEHWADYTEDKKLEMNIALADSWD